MIIAAPTIVRAAVNDETEEVTYEDLVNELASHQRRITTRTSSPFDDVRVHAGFGLVNSVSTFDLGDRKVSRYQNGLQLSAGVDLFSPNWFAETAWRNFGLTTNGTEEHTLRELDLKFGYRDRINQLVHYRLQSGLADRSLKLTDSARDLNISAQTPNIMGGGGIVLQFAPHASLNIDAAARAPVIGNTADKGSFDLCFDFKVSL